MKMFMFVLSMLVGMKSFAATPIIEYGYAMQAHGSVLTVFDDGTMAYKERQGYRYLPETVVKLDAKVFADLKELIEISTRVELTSAAPVLDHSAAGNLYGSLIVTNSHGDRSILRKYEMVFLNSQPYRKVELRGCHETNEIVKFIAQFVNDDMPMEPGLR